jgi:hypothetical protein
MAMAAFPPTDEEAGLKGMGDGFPESPSPMAMPAPSFGSASEPVPQIGNGFSVGSSPTSNGFDAPKVSEESRTFAPPFHAFATGSSVDSESGTSKNLFGDPTPAASLWDSDPTSNDDGAPTLLSPMGEVAAAIPAASLFGAENSGSASLFADIGTGGTASAFTGFEEDDSDKAPMESPVPAMTASPVAPPALPAMATSPDMERQDAAGTPTFTAMPQVTSQTLGAKPKPTVRKGFIVLMVVIVGFASGAALASFVLPVEEYVSAARSFMESKFSSGVAVPRMPALPALPAEMNVSNPSSVSATTTDPQP